MSASESRKKGEFLIITSTQQEAIGELLHTTRGKTGNKHPIQLQYESKENFAEEKKRLPIESQTVAHNKLSH